MSGAQVRHWRTTSFGDSTDTSPIDLQALGQHVRGCSGADARLVALRGAAQVLRRFAAARRISTLVVLTLLTAALLL